MLRSVFIDQFISNLLFKLIEYQNLGKMNCLFVGLLNERKIPGIGHSCASYCTGAPFPGLWV